MALVNCKECKKEISKSAKTCPHCGVKNPGIAAKDYIAGFGAILLIVFFISQCSTSDAPEDAAGENEQAESALTNPVLKDGGYVGCVSEEYLDQYVRTSTTNDRKGFQYLVDNNLCVGVSSKLSFSILDVGLLTSKIRVYVEQDAVELWIPTEAIQR